MKTRYIIAIAASLASCIACQKNDIGTVYAVGDSIVRFAPSVSCGNVDALTKGTLYNETGDYVSLGKYVDNFMVAAWNTPEGVTPAKVIPDDKVKTPESYVTNAYQKVKKRTGADGGEYWMTVQGQLDAFKTTLPDADDEYIWKKISDTKAETKTFYAYANLPLSGATVTNADATGQTLEYTAVPATAAAQNDILLGYYKGEGKTGPSESEVMTGTAGIVFQHPLTAVKFVVGDIKDNKKITGISIKGLASSGQVTMDAAGALGVWTAISNYDLTASVSNSATLAKGDVIGSPFVVIPQNLTAHSVDVTVTLEDGTGGTLTLNADNWQAGYTNTYTINFGTRITYSLTITPWDNNERGDIELDDKDYQYEFNVADNYIVFSNTTDVMTKTFSIESYRHEKGDDIIPNREPVAYNAEYSIDGGTTWLPFDAEKKAGSTGIRGLSASGNTGYIKPALVPLTAAAKTADGTASIKRWKYDEIQASNWDLSRMQIGGEGDGTAVRNTANCYIVKHPGTYMLPCVYGNSIQNGVETDKGYKSTIAAGNVNVLSNFVNAAGTDISNAWVLKDIIPSKPAAALLWTDAMVGDELLIDNVKLVNASGADFNASVDGYDNAYIKFSTADRENMVQGNAVVVLYDDTITTNGAYDEGEALWSWHLWVTDADLSAENTGVVSNDVKFMSRNLGWCDGEGGTVYRSLTPNVLIRLTQDHSSNNQLVTVLQRDAIEGQYATYGNCCFYQHGRKDPFVGTKENAGFHSGESTGMGKTYYDELGTGKTDLINGYASIFPTDNPPKCVSNSVRYPSTYAATNSYENKYVNLWAINNASFGIDITIGKTVYDPSPYGYVMPDENCFSSFIAANASFDKYKYTSTFKNKSGNIDDNLIFPACGCRYYTDGNIFYHIGYIGDYWSASVYIVNSGFNLYTVVSGGTTTVTQSFLKAHGFPARPILEQ